MFKKAPEVDEIAALMRASALLKAGLAPENSAHIGPLLQRTLSICAQTGAAPAPVIDHLIGGIEDAKRAESERKIALAGPGASARLLGVLPAAALGLGIMLGANPFGFFFGSAAGFAVFMLGIGFEVAGMWWMRRLLQGAATGEEMDVPFALDLVAACVNSGSAMPRAIAVVGAHFDENLAVAGKFLEIGGLPVEAKKLCGKKWESLWEIVELAWDKGFSPVEMLRQGARAQRAGAAAAAREKAAELGVKLVVPLGTTLLPAFVLLGIVPIVLSQASAIMGV
ncbi:MAG: hypothetical protein Q4A71_05305 [Actinomycetaceae bacterium]|nr:hypothetical protein [Actinomycetaceae bacterium]